MTPKTSVRRLLPEQTTGRKVSAAKKDNASVGAQVRESRLIADQLWQKAVQRSHEYMNKLEMSVQDIRDLNHFQRVISVQISNKEIFIVPKNTCGYHNGDGWRYMLQPRCRSHDLTNIGQGTAKFAILTDEDHEEVLSAIGAGNVQVVQDRFWP